MRVWQTAVSVGVAAWLANACSDDGSTGGPDALGGSTNHNGGAQAAGGSSGGSPSAGGSSNGARGGAHSFAGSAGAGANPSGGAADAGGADAGATAGGAQAGGAASAGAAGTAQAGGAVNAGGAAGAADAGGAAGAGGACTNPCGCPARYTGSHCEHRLFQGIGLPNGATGSTADALSRDGKYLIGSASDDSGTHALRYDIDDAISQFVEPDDATNCHADAISGDGSVVIGRCAKTYAFSAGSAHYLQGELADALVSGVSSDASVLVGVWPASAQWPAQLAFRATQQAFTLLHCADDSMGSTAESVSADGNVVVVNCNAEDPPYRWSPLDGMEPLPLEEDFDPREGPTITATLVSSDGSTIFGHYGYFDDLSWTSFSAVVRWRNGEILAPPLSGQPAGTNFNGEILARNDNVARLRPVMSFRHEAHVDDGSGTDPFQAIRNSPDAAGWDLSYITGMSDDGKVIIGNSVHDGHQEGWVAHLP